MVLLLHSLDTEALRSLLLPLVNFLSHGLVLRTGVVIIVRFFSFFGFCHLERHRYSGFSVFESLMESNTSWLSIEGSFKQLKKVAKSTTHYWYILGMETFG